MEPNYTPRTVYLCSVTHNGLIDSVMAGRFFLESSQRHNVDYKIIQTSLLASGCNRLWCDALNQRKEKGYTWFAMLHADVVPEPWWLDRMIEIAELNHIDMLSAIIPIKDVNGVTSTAISGIDEFNRFTRLTMAQVNNPKFPSIADINDVREALADMGLFDFTKELDGTSIKSAKRFLLANTGCMIVRLDQSFSNNVHFTINDRIIQDIGGVFREEVEPEDWYFSKQIAEFGGEVFVTKAIKIEHKGGMSYRSDQVWGQKVDPSTFNI